MDRLSLFATSVRNSSRARTASAPRMCQRPKTRDLNREDHGPGPTDGTGRETGPAPRTGHRTGGRGGRETETPRRRADDRSDVRQRTRFLIRFYKEKGPGRGTSGVSTHILMIMYEFPLRPTATHSLKPLRTPHDVDDSEEAFHSLPLTMQRHMPIHCSCPLAQVRCHHDMIIGWPGHGLPHHGLRSGHLSRPSFTPTTASMWAGWLHEDPRQ